MDNRQLSPFLPVNGINEDDICRICGDKAIGFNFCVVSCDSCRSFFRRCGAEKKTPQCPFNGNCNITKASRKFCRACRLQKCYKEGMRHENIKTSDINHHQVKSPKTSKPKARKTKTKCTCKCLCGFYPPNVELVAVSTPTPSLNEQNSPDTNYNSPCSTSTLASLNNFSPVEQTVGRSLSEDDQFLLNELISANSVLRAPMELTLKELEMASTEISFLTVVRISELAMRRIITMAKLLSCFQKIHQKDQIALLKGGLSELLILRGVMCFDTTKGSWTHNIYSGSRHINLHVDVLKKTPEQQHYEVHKNFLNTFDERWRKNEMVMLILNAIVLFSSNRPNIQDILLVYQTQQAYIDLLERYLHTECQSNEADNAFKMLMQQLLKLREVNQSLQLVYNRLNPDDLEPLLKELFATVQP